MAIKIGGQLVIDDSRQWYGRDLVPNAGGTFDLGTPILPWADIWVNGIANVNTLKASSLGADIDCADHNMTKVDINTGHIASAVTIDKDPVVTLWGAVVGSGTMTNLGDVSFATAIANDAVNSAHYAANSIDAAHLNVSGDGTTSQFLRSDGDGSFTWITPSFHYIQDAGTGTSYNLLMTGGGAEGVSETYADFAQLRWDALNNKFTTNMHMGELFYTHKNAYLASSAGTNFTASTNGGMKNSGYISLHGNNLMYIWNDGHIRDSAESDERFKENWNMIDNALDKVNTLDKIGSFTYKDSVKIQDPASEPSEPSIHFGLSAQEMQAILPSSVKTIAQEENDPNTPEWDIPVDVGDRLALDYNAALCLALKAIKELSAKVDALENE